MENTKRDLSLDFTKPRVPRGGQPAPSLVTPILNLSTPELNKMISEEELAVLTPNGISSVIPQSNVLPSPLIPTTVNNSNNIINSNSCIGNTSHHSHPSQHNNRVISTHHNNRKKSSESNSRQPDISQEIDLEKIEKKRERNRLAAKKCRQRKLETIDDLRKEVSQWEQRYNKELVHLQQKYRRLESDFEQFKCVRGKELDALRSENNELKGLLARQ